MGTKGLGTIIICQVGLIVRDVEASAKMYSQIFGMPKPDVELTDEPSISRTMYRGKPTGARAKLAFFDMGQVTLELIEPVGAPSTWQEFLDEKGEGVHHIASLSGILVAIGVISPPNRNPFLHSCLVFS